MVLPSNQRLGNQRQCRSLIIRWPPNIRQRLNHSRYWPKSSYLSEADIILCSSVSLFYVLSILVVSHSNSRIHFDSKNRQWNTDSSIDQLFEYFIRFLNYSGIYVDVVKVLVFTVYVSNSVGLSSSASVTVSTALANSSFFYVSM